MHDGTLKAFIDHQRSLGKAPKTVNNAIGVVSAVLNRAARVWRGEDGTPWLKQAPPRLSRLSIKGQQARSYPLSWVEQDRLVRELPGHLADAVLFALNTGCREQEVCKLRWDWEVEVPELDDASSSFSPRLITKTGTERVVVLNAVARQGRRRAAAYAPRVRVHLPGQAAHQTAQFGMEAGVEDGRAAGGTGNP